MALSVTPVRMSPTRPPRVLQLSSRRGQTAGAPGDRAGRQRLVRAALGLLETAPEGGSVALYEEPR